MVWGQKSEANAAEEGFDHLGGDMCLGDLMRGERATLGKSLLDVQRELKIKASYISAIENADPTAFDTPGFIAGYVRSYARYLGMEPDATFAKFCAESGFETAHGMSQKASAPKPAKPSNLGDNPFSQSVTPFTPEADPLFAGIEPRAVGSVAILLALIGAIGYGGWALFKDIQRVDFAPVEQAPEVGSTIDPLAGATLLASNSFDTEAPRNAALDRLYRPQALEVPVLTARDSPIGTLSPRTDPVAAPSPVELALAAALAGPAEVAPDVQVTADPAPQVALLAVRPVWVRVRSADGTVILEKTLAEGEEYPLPANQEAATLRSGNSGSLFFKVGNKVYGPAGEGGQTVSQVALSSEAVRQNYEIADATSDNALAPYVNFAQADTGQ